MLSSTTWQQVLANAQMALTNLRRDLEVVNDLQQFLAGTNAAGLEAIGAPAADAQDVLDGVADADALYQLYATGQLTAPPAGYTTPGTYVFGASQRIVIGPASS